MKLSVHELAEIKYIDFHTHKKLFKPDTLNVISVELSDLKSLAMENLEDKFFSIGLHPWRLPDNTDNLDDDLRRLRKTLEFKKVVAIGESGFDRLWGPPLKVQEIYFSEIVKLAEELNKPVIVHCVRCYPELLAVKKHCARDLKILVHGYNGNVDILKQLLKHDFYVSFGPVSLKREDICEFICRKPKYLSRICLETDDSGITIKEIYERAAEVFQMNAAELELLMKENFISLFQDSLDV